MPELQHNELPGLLQGDFPGAGKGFPLPELLVERSGLTQGRNSGVPQAGCSPAARGTDVCLGNEWQKVGRAAQAGMKRRRLTFRTL